MQYLAMLLYLLDDDSNTISLRIYIAAYLTAAHYPYILLGQSRNLAFVPKATAIYGSHSLVSSTPIASDARWPKKQSLTHLY